MGLTIGLNEAITYANRNPEIQNIRIYADNVAAITTVTDPKPTQGQTIAYMFYKSMLRWLDASPTNQLSISWCPGHTQIRGNERADELAKEATALPSSIDPTITSAKRRAQECLLHAWTTKWKNRPQQGRYAPANQIPPALHPTPHFHALQEKREIFGCLMQCRTGHGYFGGYYR